MSNYQDPEYYSRDGVPPPAKREDGPVQLVEVLEQLDNWNQACAIKYIYRFKKKNKLEDLMKARWYLDRLIAQAEEGLFV